MIRPGVQYEGIRFPSIALLVMVLLILATAVPVSATDGNGDIRDNAPDNQPLVALPDLQESDSDCTGVAYDALPSVTTISPATVNISSPRFNLTVNGASFSVESVVQWNGENKTTYFLSPARLRARIRAADVASVGTYAVTVFTPGQDGGLSNGVNVTVKAVPRITSIRPYEMKAGSPPFLISVIGSRFTPGSRVMWNGTARTTHYMSKIWLQAEIRAADVAAWGSYPVRVKNPGIYGGLSNAKIFDVFLCGC